MLLIMNFLNASSPETKILLTHTEDVFTHIQNIFSNIEIKNKDLNK